MKIALAVILTALSGLSGCQINDAPRSRLGTLPTPPPGTRFCEPNNLGSHSYYFNLFEKNGIVYTCKAGHVDLSHLRCVADHTRYLIQRTRETLIKNKERFSFIWETSEHCVKFGYPGNWSNLPREEKERIADRIAFEVGPYLAYNIALWHEITTWFGARFAGIDSEFNSAFSWEDVYSDLLGTKLAVEALKDNEGYRYDKAMTLAINRKLKELEPRSKEIAIYASEKMRGEWFTGSANFGFTGNVNTLKKNMDIGLDDGYVTPILSPGICEGVEPEPLAVPNVDGLSKCGFSMEYKIDPRIWEKGKILRIINPAAKRIEPAKHYPQIMDFIKKQAVKKYGYDISERKVVL